MTQEERKEHIAKLIEALNDVIQADDEQREVVYGTRYREIAGLITFRALEELTKM